MHISGAKFEEHHSNITRDIYDLVFYWFSGFTCGVITFPIGQVMFSEAIFPGRQRDQKLQCLYGNQMATNV